MTVQLVTVNKVDNLREELDTNLEKFVWKSEEHPGIRIVVQSENQTTAAAAARDFLHDILAEKYTLSNW